MNERVPKVWCDEDTSEAQAGDFYVDCMGSWIIDHPDGVWRPFVQMTDEERERLHALCQRQ